MDLTNRILIIGAALLWIFVLIIVILLAWGAPDESIKRIADLAGYLQDHNDSPAKMVITLGCVILALLAVIIVIAEVAPPEGGSLKVSNAGSSDARIPTEEVAHLIEAELRQMPELEDIQANVLARGEKAEVSLELHVGPEADLAATVESACNRASELLAHRIGVAVTRPPSAQVHYRELRVAKSPPASMPDDPLAPPASAQPPAYSAPAATTESSHEASQTTTEDDRPAAP
ncbi:MAG: hypothetical protein WBD55_12780 [Dehalococcoidia bacterium]